MDCCSHLANSADECFLVFQFGVVVGACEVENAPALGAFQYGAWPVTVVAVPVVVAHSLQATTQFYHYHQTSRTQILPLIV